MANDEGRTRGLGPLLARGETMMEAAATPVMELTLALAVPLWVNKIRDEQWSFEKRAERAQVCAQVVAEKGDVLQFGGGRKGEAASAFNRLAEGLACLAFQPGGVKFGELHFEERP